MLQIKCRLTIQLVLFCTLSTCISSWFKYFQVHHRFKKVARMRVTASWCVKEIKTHFSSKYTGVIHKATYTFFSSRPMLRVEFCSEALQPLCVRRLRIEVDMNCQKAVKTLCCTVMTSLDRGKALYVKQESQRW